MTQKYPLHQGRKYYKQLFFFFLAFFVNDLSLEVTKLHVHYFAPKLVCAFSFKTQHTLAITWKCM